MQRMNSNLVLQASQQPNVMAALSQGTQAAGMANEVQDANNMRNFFAQNGQGVMSGDQNALAGLAALGPQGAQMAMGAQDRQREYQMQQERLSMARAAGARAAASAAKSANAAQLAQEREQIGQGLAMAYPAIQSGDMARVAEVFVANGLEAPADLDSAMMTIAQFEGAIEVIDRFTGMQPKGTEGDLTGFMNPAPTTQQPGLSFGANVPSASISMTQPAPQPQQAGVPTMDDQTYQRILLEGDTAQVERAKQIWQAQQPETPADEYGRYVEEMRAAGQPPLDRIQFAQAKRDGQSFSVTTPDGTSINYGNRASTNLGTSGQSNLDTREIGARETLSRLDTISENFNSNLEVSDAQSLLGQVKRMGLEWKDFITGGNLTPDQERFLVDVTNMRGDVLENVNFTIQQITGAAMGVEEAKRITATLPNVDDGPVVFQAKLERGLETTRMAVLRYNYWRNNGLEGEPMSVAPLSGMDDFMKNRAKELVEQEMRSGGDPVQAKERARRLFAQEFGIE